MTDKLPMIAVIATNASTPDILWRTLESLGRADLPAGWRGVWVVENGGTHRAVDAVVSAPDRLKVRHLPTPDRGKCRALNQAAKWAAAMMPGALMVLLDDDVRVDTGTLTAYADAASARPANAFFGGPTDVDYERDVPVWLLDYLPVSARGWSHGGGPVTEPVFLGFNWAAYAKDILAVGGFDESRGPGSGTATLGDEGDMQQRLLDAGNTAHYVQAAKVWHWVPADKCTPDWALERNYQQGLEAGRQVGPNERLPLWLRRRQLVAALRKLAAPIFGANAAFAAEHKARFNAGLADGMRLASR
ncbi:MAG: glycosyltransferase [Planctomycetota bacterium]